MRLPKAARSRRFKPVWVIGIFRQPAIGGPRQTKIELRNDNCHVCETPAGLAFPRDVRTLLRHNHLA
jgi:hypothetical protein